MLYVYNFHVAVSVNFVIDHSRRQNVVRTEVTHSPAACVAVFLLLAHFDLICVLFLKRRTATQSLFFNYMSVTVLSNK